MVVASKQRPLPLPDYSLAFPDIGRIDDYHAGQQYTVLDDADIVVVVVVASSVAVAYAVVDVGPRLLVLLLKRVPPPPSLLLMVISICDRTERE